jgi:hypothetical protein
MNLARRRLTVLAASVVVASLTCLTPRASEACSPTCNPSVVTFEDQTLPGNVRALPVPYFNAEPVLLLDGAFVLTKTEQHEDGSRDLVPTAPLAAGSYALEYHSACGGTAKSTAKFVVGAALAEPQATGKLVVTTHFVPGVKGAREANGASCDEGEIAYDHVVADVTFEPASELGSYVSLTHFSAALEGSSTPWKKTFDVPAKAKAATLIASFTADCSLSRPQATPPGVYTMSVAGQIAGSTTLLPTSTASIDLTCPAGSGANYAEPEGSTGCSVGKATRGGAPARGTALLCLGAAAVAVVLRRRRAR